ncbi:polysaccharide deacetylase family protein [Cohnella sp. WQ 127256]|uniref:polysaccharide deacetylase family protein n=1 Tax=Cohnella sp. WQ 127256 TaxID=2938790 RepID=UPI00211921E7|nr:polysaccharide deacetylase family protein [Cohnella sp. WQ 127256]
MKRNHIILVFIAVLLTNLLAACAKTPDEVTVVIDGVELKVDYAVMINDGQLYVPTSFIEQVFKMKVETTTANERGDGAASYYSDQVAVMMYHGIEDDPNPKSELATAELEKQLSLLKSNGFNVISMEQYISFMLEGATIPDNAVLLTFDDGYENFYTKAYPLLIKYDYPAVNFVIVSSIDNPKGAPKMTWDQMREMQKAGMSFYSHTYDLHKYGVMNEKGTTKPVMTRKQYSKATQTFETDEHYTTRITSDLSKAEQRLKEELGNTRGIIAFPYGAYNDDVMAILKSLGIELSFTVKEGLNTADQKNAFRINGAKKDETAEQVIERLKSLGSDESTIIVSINGEKMIFSELQPLKRQDEILIPLREFCKKYDIKVDWNNKKKQVSLTT